MLLEGIRVLDCAIWQMGPAATAFLGDLGAEVIKIEESVNGDPARATRWLKGESLELPQGKSWYFEQHNRNKKGITLNLKTEEGKQVLFRLVEKSDVFVQNFRPGVAERLGIDYKALSSYNPMIIYASATGFGRKGPDAKEPAFDLLGQARSGLMTTAGEPDGPPVMHSEGIVDQIGAIMLGYGMVVALLARERLGIGQEVDSSQLGSIITLMTSDVSYTLAAGHNIPPVRRRQAYNPLWNIYECSDGKWIALAMLQSDRYWSTVCQALGLPELVDDHRFCNMERRGEN
jgi:crotonobetainyl-CoA:carnitine CoA-transferase CaiB-like acyl-CoA transferase